MRVIPKLLCNFGRIFFILILFFIKFYKKCTIPCELYLLSKYQVIRSRATCRDLHIEVFMYFLSSPLKKRKKTYIQFNLYSTCIRTKPQTTNLFLVGYNFIFVSFQATKELSSSSTLSQITGKASTRLSKLVTVTASSMRVIKSN